MVDPGLTRPPHLRTKPQPARPRVGSRLLLASVWTLSCASQETAAPARAPGPDVPVEPLAGFADGFGTVEARGQGLELLLPNPEGWHVDPAEKLSWVVRHRRSESALVVRVWHSDAAVHPEDCERQARAWRPDLPRPDPSEIVQSSRPRLAGDYDGRLTVGIGTSTRAPNQRKLAGYALAFASAARSCLLLAFSTFAEGPGARRSIADRLALIVPTAFLRAHRVSIERPGLERRVIVPAQ